MNVRNNAIITSTQAKMASEKRIIEFSNVNGSAYLEQCRISAVNESKLTVDVELIERAMMLKDVSIIAPVSGYTLSEVSLPTVGSMAVLATTNKGKSFVVGFQLTTTNGKPNLLEGEIFKSSQNGGYMKLDKDGNAILGSKGANQIIATRSGDNLDISSTKYEKTLAEERISGVVENKSEIQGSYKAKSDVSIVESIYDNVGSKKYDNIDDSDIFDENFYPQVLDPIIIIHKGNVLDNDLVRQKLIIEANPVDNAELAYKFSIIQPNTQNHVLSILLDKAGNVRIEAEKVILKAKSLDLRECDEIKLP